MAYRLGAFSGVGLDEALLRLVIDEHTRTARPRLDRLWTYFRNPLRPVGPANAPKIAADRAGWYTLGQEVGLPHRVTGRPPHNPDADDRVKPRREVVIENDIAWRVQSMIDFMFGRPLVIRSTAKDHALRKDIDHALDLAWDASGGIALMQDAALLGHVFGHVDLAVRYHPDAPPDRAASVEIIDPRRGVPVLDPDDYRRILAYIVHFNRDLNRAEGPRWWERAASGVLGNPDRPRRGRAAVTRIIAAHAAQTYEDDRLVLQEDLAWTRGQLPVVHVQNLSQPFAWEGLGEVEPLIPLQDELNTRLSDRACRVTMQSFKMYLAKGIDGFENVGVAPGIVWSTDNPDASVEAFGGDTHNPSEDAHIAQVRDAMDKVSSVPPLAGGVVQGRIGNLSSATALRVTLMGLLAKTARKRVTYGRGIEAASRLILKALHHSGALRTRDQDRGLRLEWPDPVPVAEHERVLAAEGKARLGVPNERVLEELGYPSAGVGADPRVSDQQEVNHAG
ncbi:MAG: phage portal protein [Phycisphaeraceae bacterium]|nr:MAG: phage portal protein [Phycisphaeraceae bacterium]